MREKKLPLVERSFAWLGRNRRLSKDYKYCVQSSETLIEFAATRLMLNRLAEVRLFKHALRIPVANLGDSRRHFLGRWRWRRENAFGAWQRAMRREQRGYRTRVAGRRYFAGEGQAASILTKQFRRESFRTVRRVLLSFAPWQHYGGT